MASHEDYMKLCIEEATKSLGGTAPNPMVGCIIEHQGEIIACARHQKYGEAHAEVNAINAVEDKSLLTNSTLYVTLEPCSHKGKTPPCADLIIASKIPRVVIGIADPYSEVNGKGIEKLKANGVEVILGILREENLELNKRFITFHTKKRPYIILKWAQTSDGFIDVKRDVSTPHKNWITSEDSKKLVHQWRSEEQAILIGTNTALNDNPQLNTRLVKGKSPLRLVIDQSLKIPKHYHVLDGSTPTVVFNAFIDKAQTNLKYVKVDFKNKLIPQILEYLYQNNIQSLIVEGGFQLLNSFICENLWDEARVFTAPKKFEEGLKAPVLKNKVNNTSFIGNDRLELYLNKD